MARRFWTFARWGISSAAPVLPAVAVTVGVIGAGVVMAARDNSASCSAILGAVLCAGVAAMLLAVPRMAGLVAAAERRRLQTARHRLVERERDTERARLRLVAFFFTEHSPSDPLEDMRLADESTLRRHATRAADQVWSVAHSIGRGDNAKALMLAVRIAVWSLAGLASVSFATAASTAAGAQGFLGVLSTTAVVGVTFAAERRAVATFVGRYERSVGPKVAAAMIATAGVREFGAPPPVLSARMLALATVFMAIGVPVLYAALSVPLSGGSSALGAPSAAVTWAGTVALVAVSILIATVSERVERRIHASRWWDRRLGATASSLRQAARARYFAVRTAPSAIALGVAGVAVPELDGVPYVLVLVGMTMTMAQFGIDPTVGRHLPSRESPVISITDRFANGLAGLQRGVAATGCTIGLLVAIAH